MTVPDSPWFTRYSHQPAERFAAFSFIVDVLATTSVFRCSLRVVRLQPDRQHVGPLSECGTILQGTGSESVADTFA